MLNCRNSLKFQDVNKSYKFQTELNYNNSYIFKTMLNYSNSCKESNIKMDDINYA